MKINGETNQRADEADGDAGSTAPCLPANCWNRRMKTAAHTHSAARNSEDLESEESAKENEPERVGGRPGEKSGSQPLFCH